MYLNNLNREHSRAADYNLKNGWTFEEP